MASNDVVRARIDEHIKNDATVVLREMGLTVSDIVRIMLTRIARDRALPFDFNGPNAETRAAIQEARALSQAGSGRFKNAEDMFNEFKKDEGRWSSE